MSTVAIPNVTARAKGLPYELARERLASRPARAIAVGRLARILAPAGLVVLMAVGSVVVWTAIPLAGMWLVSQLSDSYVQLPVGPTLAAAIGLPAAMALGVKVLARLERVYLYVTGKPTPAVVVPGWRRSVGDLPSSPPATVLEKIMVANVLVALIALIVWFFGFAGTSLPA
jgi:hypothetical protein